MIFATSRRQPPKPLPVSEIPNKPRIIVPITTEPKRGSRPILLEKAKEHQCRFIHGDARSMMVCGDQVALGCSWCTFHMRIVFQTVKGAKTIATPVPICAAV